MVLQPKRVDGFGQTRSERYDAVDRLRDANRAAGFIGDFPKDWRCGRDRRSALSTGQCRAGQQQGCGSGQEGASETQTCDFFHESPVTRELQFSNKKAPRDTLGLPAT